VLCGLCLIFGMIAIYLKAWRSRSVQTSNNETCQRGCSSSSRPLPTARFPREETDLATFVTRMPMVWRRHQLAGNECFLILID
jgi:hypothetical protein